MDFTHGDPTAKSDIEALRNAFDTNHDGKLDAADDDWALFKVVVTNPDGTTEVKSLADLDITSLDQITNTHSQVFAVP